MTDLTDSDIKYLYGLSFEINRRFIFVIDATFLI